MAFDLKIFAKDRLFKSYLAKVIHLDDLRNGATKKFTETFDALTITLFRS
jgi:hypothetical protein